MPPDHDPDHGLEANYLATSLWPEAVKLYEKTSKPFAELPKFNSIDELYVYVERSATKFKEFREDSPSWMNKLRSKIKPVACVVQTLSGALGDAVSMPYSPMKAVFTAIGVVVETAMKVKEDFDDILTVFDMIDQYLRIIAPLASCNMHEALRGASVKLLAQILNVFGVIGKTQKEGRMKHFIKKLAHGKEVPDALKDLGRLASTHHQMISAVTLDTVRRMMHTLADFISNNKREVAAAGFCLEQIKEIVRETHRLLAQTSTSSMEQRLDDRKAFERVKDDLLQAVAALKSQEKDLAMIYTWLQYPDFSARMNEALEARAKGTGFWFLDSTQSTQFASGRGRVFWVHGSAGSGKSTIIAVAIREMQARFAIYEEPKVLLAHYFDATNSLRRRDLKELISSLLCQLVDVSDEYLAALMLLRNKHKQGHSQPLLDDLKHHLRDFLASITLPIVVVIDALDEADDDGIIAFLQDLLELNPRVSLVISSRTEVPYHEDLRHLADIQLAISKHLVQLDISVLLDSVLAGPLAKLKAGDVQLVRRILSNGSEGNFRWTLLQSRELAKVAGIPSMVRKMLQTLPRRLRDIYDKVVDDLPREQLKTVQRLLGWLLFAKETLSRAEFTELLAYEFPEDDDLPTYNPELRPTTLDEVLVLISSTFISYRNDSVHIAHNSVRDYLLDVTSPLYIPPPSAHFAMMRMCLSCLMMALPKSPSDVHPYSRLKDWYPLGSHSYNWWTFYA
ncbi:hypothetical protein EV122DRAFT_223290, partial [Schizophyllum commune]